MIEGGRRAASDRKSCPRCEQGWLERIRVAPTPQDELLLALVKEHELLPEVEPLWGIGHGKERPPTPSREAAERALAHRAAVRARLLRELRPELEPAGADAVLQVTHWFRDQRTLANGLAEDLLSLLVVGRAEEAVALYAAGHRMARLVGRGIQGQPTLIAKMIEIAEEFGETTPRR